VQLEGKVALVTGASRGVGAAVAVALAQAGTAVACAARATDAAPVRLPGTIDETVRRAEVAGGRALAVPTNLAREDEVERMVAATVDHFGGLDILVNNAAITFPGDIDLPMARFDLIFAVNLRAPVVAARAAIPILRERGGGAILNVSSLAALNYFPGLTAYGMSKIALEHFTVALAAQLEHSQIAVNTLRIDVPVASEGFLANVPDVDHSDWEPPEVAAEGVVWMLRQPPTYTGNNVGMARLRAEHGIMQSRAARAHDQVSGIVTDSSLQFRPRRPRR
jgi:NAD(P)-dependent dehydrogenase (short-subunit alcohol dehydrogenase family)